MLYKLKYQRVINYSVNTNYGSGHGKPASYKGLEERHAKLAVGSSITLVEFLWCTHERTKNDTKF